MYLERAHPAFLTTLVVLVFGCNSRDVGCEEARCYLTSNRKLLGSVSNFDAVVFHQRSFTFKDAPPAEMRRPEQRYIHWMFESPAHLNRVILNC